MNHKERLTFLKANKGATQYIPPFHPPSQVNHSREIPTTLCYEHTYSSHPPFRFLALASWVIFTILSVEITERWKQNLPEQMIDTGIVCAGIQEGRCTFQSG